MKVPTQQSQILTKTFLEYKDFISSDKIKTLTDKEEFRETLKIFYRISDEDVNAFKYSTLKDMYKILVNVLNTKQELVRTFKLDGVEYGLVPNFDDLTFAEVVDCDTEDVYQQIAVLYRPIIKKKKDKYKIKKYKANIEHYDRLKEELTLDVYNSFISFFLSTQKEILKYSVHSLTGMDIDPTQRKILGKLGVG